MSASKNLIYRLTLGLLLFLFFGLTSCKQKNNTRFYYAEGNIIQDTNQLKLLNEELSSVLKNTEQYTNLKVYTSLSYEKKKTFEKVLDGYRIEYLNVLKKEFPKVSNTLDSLNYSKKLVRASIIVFNNQSGEIENYTLDKTLNDRTKENILNNKAIRPYGYLIALNKDVSLEDTFIYRYGWRKTPHYTSVFENFNYISPDLSRIDFPFSFYPKKEWINLEKKLDINLDLSDFKNTGGTPEVRTSLFDLTKTFSIIQKNGFLQKPILIRKIQKNDNVVYQRIVTKKQVINDASIKKMKLLLSKSMLEGWNVMHYRKYKIIEDCIIYNGGWVNCRWKVYSTDKYTIGMLEYYVTYIKTKEGKYIDFSYNKYVKRYYNLLLSKVLNGMNLNKVKGKNYYTDKKRFHDEIFNNYGL